MDHSVMPLLMLIKQWFLKWKKNLFLFLLFIYFNFGLVGKMRQEKIMENSDEEITKNELETDLVANILFDGI